MILSAQKTELLTSVRESEYQIYGDGGDDVVGQASPQEESEVVCRGCSRIFSDSTRLARHIEIAGLANSYPASD